MTDIKEGIGQGVVKPMSEEQHLLICLAEECSEVAQRVSKALRFGLDEVQRDQPLTNAERIVEELHDLMAVAALLGRRGVLINPTFVTADEIERKQRKIERYFAISLENGTLSAPAAIASAGGQK